MTCNQYAHVCEGIREMARVMSTIIRPDCLEYEKKSSAKGTPSAAVLSVFLHRLATYEPGVALIVAKFAFEAVNARATEEAQWELRRWKHIGITRLNASLVFNAETGFYFHHGPRSYFA